MASFIKTSNHEIRNDILDSILKRLDSSGPDGLSEQDVVRDHVRMFKCTDDTIEAVVDCAVDNHQIVRYKDDFKGKWLVSTEYALVYTAVPWIASENRCNYTFSALLRGKVLSILSKRPGLTGVGVQRELHILSLYHTDILLSKMEAQGLIVSTSVKRRLEVRLFEWSCPRDEQDVVYHIR